jgi:uncharacterized DUF497 family protein
MRFEWDEEKAEENLAKHGVSFSEAAETFADDGAVEYFDPEHSNEDERRYARVALSYSRLLFVVYTERGDAVRIIHARKPSRRMREDYEEQNQS